MTRRPVKILITLGMVFFLISSLTALAAPMDNVDEIAEKGEIQTPAGTVTFLRTSRQLVFSDIHGAIVFKTVIAENVSEVISGFGFRRDLGLYVFKNRFCENSRRYSLMLESQAQAPRMVTFSDKPFYSPGITKSGAGFVFFTTENQEIVILDLNSSREICRKKFQVPVIETRVSTRANRECIIFRKFNFGTYESVFIYTDEISPARFPVIHSMGAQNAPAGASFFYNPDNTVPLEERPEENTVLGFGDSITYGYVNKQPAPNSGYIPRLQNLLNMDYPQVTVINEGAPGTTTVVAMERFIPAIRLHNPRYLLFHYGINDTIHASSIPVSTVVFNIRFMMEEALKRGISPVLTTIIQRDPNHSTGSGISRVRAIAIAQEIRQIAADLDLPLIDFWNIFADYPAADGGYYSLMSDYVHPSEKGYQLMAEKWLTTLLGIAPATPLDVRYSAMTPYRTDVDWRDNQEFDFSHYLVEYGFSENNLSRRATTIASKFSFLTFPLSNSLNRRRIFFRISSVDHSGNTSAATDVETVKPADRLVSEGSKSYSQHKTHTGQIR